MSTLIEDVGAVLATAAPAGGIWYGVNTLEQAQYPYVVYTRIVSSTNNTLAGPTDLQNTRIQVDVFGLTIAETSVLEAAVEAAMAAAPFASIQLSQQDSYESAVKAFRCSADFSVWATN